MADQSQFSRFSKKHLIFICERLLDEGFDAVNPYDNYDDSYKALEEVARYFNTPINDEDVQFFGKLLKDNDDLIADIFSNQGENKNNKDLIEQLQIPVAKDYEVEYTVDGTCNFTENYITTTSSYEKGWVLDSLNRQHDDGNFDLYEGRLESTDYDNWQMNDWNFQEVNDISPSIEESLLGRIVLENTQDALSSLDKKTLIKLKSIIESRLRLL